MTDEEKEKAIKSCNCFEDLESLIYKIDPLTSYSRPEPIEWGADTIMNRIRRVRHEGWPINQITRACGLLDKVIELLSK